jgi:hypothetical protein
MTSPEGIQLTVPIDHIRGHKEMFSDKTDEEIAEIVANLVGEAAKKATIMILENNWHEFNTDNES